ncbi:hypothetical protein ACFPVS_11340 [Neisseria weixii]|uniref:hypothetical protein n=1 Tax=Neisseria weixii TaxID=1853276 RepID=UPI001E652233|nr:hypothetical protein [Neisseria weixii]
MPNILIINGHQPYDFSKGELTGTLIDIAEKVLTGKGCAVRRSRVNGYSVEDELAKWQ